MRCIVLLIDAVNTILPKLGERPVTSVTTPHPTVSIALQVLNQLRKSVLTRGWWFNQYEYKAYPDINGEIYLSVDTLTFYPDKAGTAITRGTQLFNLRDSTFVFTEAVTGRVVQDIPFDLLPESVAHYIVWAALVQMHVSDVGMTAETQAWQENANTALATMHHEHVRQRQYSTRDKPEYQRIRRSMVN